MIDGAKPDSEERYTICTLGFVANSDDYWLLGDVFMRGFYVIHDDDNQMLGMAPHSNSDKEALTLALEMPTKVLTTFEWMLWMKILLGIGIVAGVVLLGLFGWYVWPKIYEYFTSTNLASKATYRSDSEFTLIILK